MNKGNKKMNWNWMVTLKNTKKYLACNSANIIVLKTLKYINLVKQGLLKSHLL